MPAQSADIETGLDYAQARYFANVQGRFTGVDPLMSTTKPSMPQSWNRYAYCLTNPLLFIDPTGLTWYQKKGSNQPEWFDENPGDDYEEVTKFIYQAVDGTWVLLDSNSKSGGVVMPPCRMRLLVEASSRILFEILITCSNR